MRLLKRFSVKHITFLYSFNRVKRDVTVKFVQKLLIRIFSMTLLHNMAYALNEMVIKGYDVVAYSCYVCLFLMFALSDIL